MSGYLLTRALAVTTSVILLGTMLTAPVVARPDDAAREAAQIERQAERQARAEARAAAKAARQAEREARAAARAAAKAQRQAEREARKQARKAEQKGQEKVTLCHKPKPGDATTITVGEPAVEAHLAHGDILGACGLLPIEVSITSPSVINPDQRLRLLGSHDDLEAPTWKWSSSCYTDADLTNPTLIASRPETLLLVMREDTMSAGQVCDFTLRVTEASTQRAGSASVTITVSEPPEGGSVVATPQTGVALETLFHLTAPGWSDPQTPLSYQFFYIADGSTAETALTQILPVDYADVYLPAGDITVIVRVYDSVGAWSSATTQVTVEPPGN